MKFDLGWRFWLGAEPPDTSNGSACAAVAYRPLENGTGCVNMAPGPHAASAAACEISACARHASGWQFKGGTCMLGQQHVYDLNCTRSHSGWVGGTLQDAQAPWLPPASARSFNDSSWSVVDAPHDFEIGLNYSQSNEQNEAFLPHKQAYYRKHFALPTSWDGTVIELYVEGSLSVSSWWLNGRPLLLEHQCGYVSVILRLDNVPSPLNMYVKYVC